MLLDDMVDYLSSGSPTTWTTGVNLFAGYAPETPDMMTIVYETGGQAPVYAMGNVAGEVVVERPRVQVVCRATVFDYSMARAMAHTAFKLLDKLPTRTINGVSYFWGGAVQSPYELGRDALGRVTIACNYDVVKTLSP